MATKKAPGKSGAPRPGTKPSLTGLKKKPSGTKPPTCPSAASKQRQEMLENPEPEPKAYENPAFSIPLKKVHTNPLLAEKDKQKHIRRNIPKSEDMNQIKKTLVQIKKMGGVTVGEFISLLAPFTGDNGAVLRDVLIDDMNSFRSLARKIYDTMTQDVSDVLTNQQIQLREHEKERTTLYTEKMMRAINEIFSLAPKFDFEMYYAGKEMYLSSLFPVPRLIEADSEEAEMHRRQQAYHRYNWMKTEGERLSAENARLKKRLHELKEEQQVEMQLAEAREAEAEAKRQELEAQEAAMQSQLEVLTEKVEQTMIDTEAGIRVAMDEANIQAPPKKDDAKSKALEKRKKPRGEWVSEAAAEIEEKAVEENVLAEAGQDVVQPMTIAAAIKQLRQMAKSKSKAATSTATAAEPKTPEGKKKPKKPKSPFHFSPIKTPPSKPPPPKEKSPFHFSPIKTPPSKPPPPKERSPFHFSPIKTTPAPVAKPPSPFHYSPPPERTPYQPEEPQTTAAPSQLHTTRLRTENVSVKKRVRKGGLFEGVEETPVVPTTPDMPMPSPMPGPSAQPAPRAQKPSPAVPAATPLRPAQGRGRQFAPKDSWGGFY